MPTVMIVALQVASVFLALYGVSHAESFFVPGDAYFNTSIEQMTTGNGAIHCVYERIPHRKGLVGFAGFRELDIVGDPEDLHNLMDELAAVESSVRLSRSREYVETTDGEMVLVNPVRVLVYNREYDYRGTPLCLKFNENWHRLAEVMGDTSGRAIAREYASLVSNSELVTTDWRLAGEVRGLDVSIPSEVMWWRLGRPLTEKVSISIDKCVFIVLADGTEDAVALRKKHADFYTVDIAGSRRWYWMRRRLWFGPKLIEDPMWPE